jgi:hypothetical protein
VDADDRLRLDYEQTTQLFRAFVDVRFKLLAFVPTISGIAVGLFGRPRPAAELLAVGLLGLVATLGIVVYELRNTQLQEAAMRRARRLEQQLGLNGGPFSERPAPTIRLFGVVTIAHSRGLALVYGASLGGWSYLVAWGALGALEIGSARSFAVTIAALVGAAVVVDVDRVERRRVEEERSAEAGAATAAGTG